MDSLNRKAPMRAWPYVLAYLAAIPAANLITAHYGADASIVTAFVLVGLVITTRDALHDLWGRHRLRNMAALIVTGSVISYVASIVLASDALPSDVVARIALASTVAFALAETVDAITYHAARRREWLHRSSISNLASALLDSIVFVWIAFGLAGQLPVVVGQFGAKVAGGLLFALALESLRARGVVARRIAA